MPPHHATVQVSASLEAAPRHSLLAPLGMLTALRSLVLSGIDLAAHSTGRGPAQAPASDHDGDVAVPPGAADVAGLHALMEADMGYGADLGRWLTHLHHLSHLRLSADQGHEQGGLANLALLTGLRHLEVLEPHGSFLIPSSWMALTQLENLVRWSSMP